MTVAGSVDLVPVPTADLTLTGVADLRVLNAFTSAVRVSGDATLMAEVGGTRAAPRIDGVVELDHVELRLDDPRLLVRISVVPWSSTGPRSGRSTWPAPPTVVP